MRFAAAFARERGIVEQMSNRTIASQISAALLGLGIAFAASAPGASADPCPNEAIREAQTSAALPSGSVYLPDCMALEMVSPAKKLLQGAQSPTFALDGERILFGSQAGLAETPGLQAVAGDLYVASRTPAGWGSAPTSPPAAAEIFTGTENQGGPYAFAPDFSRWDLLGATKAQAAVGSGQLFQGGLDGSLVPLSPTLVPSDDSGNLRIISNIAGSVSAASSADLSASVFRADLFSTSYLPGDPADVTDPRDQNNYVASLDANGEPSLALLARDKAGVVYGGRCGAHLGGGAQPVAGPINQGAISTDGSRIYLSTRPAQPFDPSHPKDSLLSPPCNTANPLRVLKRTETPTGPGITPLLSPGTLAEWQEPGDDLFQGASEDGTKVYLTSPRKLTASDLDTSAEPCGPDIGASKGCDLYLYDSTMPPAKRLTQVSAGGSGDPSPGKGADVLSSITAISTDGSHAYFVAQGVLTTEPNPAGATAVAGQPNLYLYERDAAHPSGHTAFIGTLAAGDKTSQGDPRLWGMEQSGVGGAYAVPMVGAGEEEGADGHILAFASKAPLTADDSDGGKSDVFRYDADAGTLARVSKAAPGGAELPASDVAVNPSLSAPNTNPAQEGRWVSEDGETIAFASAEPLAPGDEDGEPNPYLWKEGQVALLPGAEEHLGEAPPTVSRDGEEAAYSTRQRLLPQDGDTASDVYVARAGGGFPNPVAPTPCDPLVAGACRAAASQPGSEQATATDSIVTAGNQLSPKPCRKGHARKHGRCVKKHQAKKRNKGHGAKKRAGLEHGGGK
jgi:hypothetical protein